MDLQFFDRLLMKNVTSTAMCKIPHPVLPQVTCGKRDVTVKLPVGSVLKTLQVLGKGGNLVANCMG